METSTPEEIKVGEVRIRFLVEGSQAGGSVAVFEAVVPTGARVPVAHSHDGYEETIYALQGTLVWTVEGHEYEVGPGEVLCIPRGAVHQFANLGDLGAKQGILGGINAVIVGNYLTTLGRPAEADLELLDDLAMPIKALNATI